MDDKRRQQDYWNSLSRLPAETSVFDPNDHRGSKNAYIASIRDEAFRKALSLAATQNATVLDFGCGTGSASLGLLRQGYRVIGLDLAKSLLQQARMRCDDQRSLFVAIDGGAVPIAPSTLDAAVTYVVLSYVVDDASVAALLESIRGVLKPGAKFAAIEQCRKTRTVVEDGLKVHRSIDNWRDLLRSAGFRQVTYLTVRSGRFPTTPLIGLGWIPRALWPAFRASERAVGKLIPVLPGDYAEVLFEAIA